MPDDATLWDEDKYKLGDVFEELCKYLGMSTQEKGPDPSGNPALDGVLFYNVGAWVLRQPRRGYYRIEENTSRFGATRFPFGPTIHTEAGLIRCMLFAISVLDGRYHADYPG